ncbi:hypothetical protein Q9R34_19120 [Enterobacter sp. BRE11]|nr:hypothetical protein [Enterobacter sp. BRE11]
MNENIKARGLKALPPQFSHYDINLTFDILRTFNYQIELSIEKAVDSYKESGPETLGYEETGDPDEGNYHCIDYYMGLYSNEVDLDDMFITYYPSVTRRSAFLTLYGMLEHDYEKLCNGFAKSKNLRVNLSDLKGSGFERCDLFARKFMGMPTSRHMNMVKKITKLRNLCAHNDARFITNDGQEIKEAIALMEENPLYFDKDINQVNFKAGCLVFITHEFRHYFKDVEDALLNYDKSLSK